MTDCGVQMILLPRGSLGGKGCRVFVWFVVKVFVPQNSLKAQVECISEIY